MSVAVEDICVVYQLTSPSGKSYVGVTSNFERRLRNHRERNAPIGAALRKYGCDAFAVRFLCKTDRDAAYLIEQRAIARLGTLHPAGYNLDAGGRGVPAPSAATREKMRLSHLGKKPSEYTRQRVVETHRGAKRPPEWCQRISAGLRGRKISEESKAKMRAAKLGKCHTEEHRRRNSEGVRAYKACLRQAKSAVVQWLAVFNSAGVKE